MVALKIVEGEWKNYRFKIAEKSDYSGIIKHLEENFHQDEPLSVLVGNSDVKFKDLERFTTQILDDGLSIVVLEKNTGKVAGVRLTGKSAKNSEEPPFECQSEQLATIFGFFESAQKGLNLFEQYGLEEYIEFVMASVGREFRGDGLATEMYDRSLKLLRNLGFKLVKCTFTSPYTRKISSKCGFEEVARKYFRELQDTKGEYICPDKGDDEFVSVRILRL